MGPKSKKGKKSGEDEGPAETAEWFWWNSPQCYTTPMNGSPTPPPNNSALPKLAEIETPDKQNKQNKKSQKFR